MSNANANTNVNTTIDATTNVKANGKEVVSKFALTTIDNPFDPFTQFDSWYRFDADKGYNSCSYLARVAHTSDQLSDAENEKEIEHAIDEIIQYDPFNIYKKVMSK